MDWKKIAKKFLSPPLWLLTLLVILSTVALSLLFLQGLEKCIFACFVYGIAFYALCAVCVFCALELPKRYRKIRQMLYNAPLSRRFMTDRSFRTGVSLSVSLLISLLYVGINLWSWYMLQSWWFMVLAVYYVIMAIIRCLLAGYLRNQKIGANLLNEWKRARLCACILLLINLSLSGAVLMILFQNSGKDYPGILIYVMAVYTFYAAISSAVEIVRNRRQVSPIMATAKIVSLTAALVSLLNLETAMFARFGPGMSPENQRIFIVLTGAGVSVAVVTLSVILITNATKAIRRAKHGK